MMKITVSIDVPNLVKAEEFYTKALACKKIRDQAPNMVVLSTENVSIYLQEKKAGSNPLKVDGSVRDYKRHWTPIHIDFLCKNIDEVVARVVEFGGLHEGGESGDWGSIAYCADPFGNGFCIINE